MIHFMSVTFPLQELQEYMQSHEGWTLNTIGPITLIGFGLGFLLFWVGLIWFLAVDKKRHEHQESDLAIAGRSIGLFLMFIFGLTGIIQASFDYRSKEVIEIAAKELSVADGVHQVSINDSGYQWAKEFLNKSNHTPTVEVYTQDGNIYKYSVRYVEGQAYIFDGSLVHDEEIEAPPFDEL